MVQLPNTAKPIFKQPDHSAPPFKVTQKAETAPQPSAAPKTVDAPKSDWQPLSTAPTDPNARFWVRVCVNGKPINGTDTLVRYRVTRKRENKKWVPALTIIDDRLGTKLGFRPSEWKPYGKPNAD